MSLIDFGFNPTPTATRQQTTHTVVETAVAPVIEEVVARPSLAAGFAMRPEAAWGWQDLRDYVIREIEQRHGLQVRNPKTEASIFKSFMSRYEDGLSVAIAKAAFEVHDGMWRNAPISVNRFCKASDPYFADVIAANIR